MIPDDRDARAQGQLRSRHSISDAPRGPTAPGSPGLERGSGIPISPMEEAFSGSSAGESESMDRDQAYTLYTCHFLSTWNARTYEFAAVLFTASAYPEGFTASSLVGITGSVAVICFASTLGRWVDRAASRLQTLLATITANRCAIVAACVCWFFIVGSGGPNASGTTRRDRPPTGGDGLGPAANPANSIGKAPLFVIILALGILEKLSRLANVLSIERDWVPTLAPPSLEKNPSSPFGLTHVNAVMRRIDLICKLIAPLLISAFISFVNSTRLGVFSVAAMSVVSWSFEVWTARRVWYRNSRLRRSKDTTITIDREGNVERMGTLSSAPFERGGRLPPWLQTIRSWVHHHAQSLNAYFSTTVWIPSIALSITHISSLSYTATLIVYLINIGFSLNVITISKAIGAMFELSSTWVLPWGVQALSVARVSTVDAHLLRDQSGGEDEAEAEAALLDEREIEDEKEGDGEARLEIGIMRLGLWSLCGLFLCLVPVVLSAWNLPTTTAVAPAPPQTFASLFHAHPLAIPALIFFLSFSRLGRETYDLTTQQLSQIRVEPGEWSSFAGTEMSFVSLFGLGHWVSSAVLHRTQDFRWLALGSMGATGISVTMYAWWMWKERGHLVHWGKAGTRGESWGWRRRDR